MKLEEFFRRGQFAQRAVDAVLAKHAARAPEAPLAQTPATYSVGDYVWIRNSARRHELQLAKIVTAFPRKLRDRIWWTLRLRLARGWKSELDSRPVLRALTPAEVAHQRRLGHIPQHDLPLPGERP